MNPVLNSRAASLDGSLMGMQTDKASRACVHILLFFHIWKFPHLSKVFIVWSMYVFWLFYAQYHIQRC